MAFSPEEKRLRHQDAQRRYRAAHPKASRRNANTDEQLDHAADGDRPAPPPPKTPLFSIVRSVETAIQAMKWIQPSDGGLVDLAMLYAVQIDKVLSDDPTATGKAASLGQLLVRILHELGGTPTVRLQHELRSLRAQLGATRPGDEDGNQPDQRATGTEGAGKTTNVTPISRPPKRKR